jgi:ketosteroid isomerase-like protein
MRLLLFAAALFLQTPAPTATTPTLPTDQWILDMQAKNLDDILSLYTPDAVFIDPQGKQFATPDAMRKLYTDTFAAYDSDLKRGKGTIAIQGNPQVPGAIAIEAAAYTEDLTKHADHTTAHLCGDYRFTYILQQNGKWLIQRMEWTSKPCPTT